MTHSTGNPRLPPHEHAVFIVERLKALATLLASEGVGYAVTNLEENAASALFEIFESGLAEIQLSLAELAKTRFDTCDCGNLKTRNTSSGRT